MKLKSANKSFTLIEIVVAIGVIITALVASVALVSFSISSTRTSRSRIVALSLAQEGLEIIRDIRDNNWLNFRRKASNWRTGLGAGDYRVQFNASNLLSYSATPLRIDSSGFYQYDSGNNTAFYRKITLEYIGNNQIRVVAEVTWQEYGRSNNVRTETRLYNWLEEPET